MSAIKLGLCRFFLPEGYVLSTRDQTDRQMGACFLLQETLERLKMDDGTTVLRFRSTDVEQWDWWQAEYDRREATALATAPGTATGERE